MRQNFCTREITRPLAEEHFLYVCVCLLLHNFRYSKCNYFIYLQRIFASLAQYLLFSYCRQGAVVAMRIWFDIIVECIVTTLRNLQRNYTDNSSYTWTRNDTLETFQDFESAAMGYVLIPLCMYEMEFIVASRK